MELIEADTEHRPNFIGESLAEMARGANEVRPGAQGGFTARVDGKDVLVDNGNPNATSVQALRTVLEVAWSMPQPPRYIQPVSEKAESVIRGWR